MEDIYNDDRTWIISPVNVKKFQDEWTSALEKMADSLNDDMSDEECAELEAACGLDAMGGPSGASDVNEPVPEDIDLETLRFRDLDLDRRKTNRKCEKKFQKQCRRFTILKTPAVKDEKEVILFEKVEKPDVVLCVQIYRPEPNPECLEKFNSIGGPYQIEQEFLVLGSQYLVDLRDKISCLSDKAVTGDLSETPYKIPEETCGDTYKSGYFYIAGVFYNDMRYPECRDYSKRVMEWAEEESKGIGPFKKAVMEETRFVDLTIQLGCPYLYTHQGNCEHMIVFNDLLMYSNNEHSDNKFDYPLEVNVREKHRMLCMGCRNYKAEWVVRRSKRVPSTPFFFCEMCYFSFNYDEDGQKIGDFEAYKFVFKK